MNKAALKIDIVSDVVCPWCVIGFYRLKLALDMSGTDADIRWHPFELNPDMPEGGQNLREHLAGKYGTTPEGSVAARKRLTTLGAQVGFTFNYFDDMRMYNTFRAHQLLHWAEREGKQTPLKLAFFEAYFTRQESLDEAAVLLDAVARAGLQRAEAEVLLREGRYADAVRKEQREWLNRGIQGVPAFIFNDRYLVTGAQEAEHFAALLTRIEQEGLEPEMA